MKLLITPPVNNQAYLAGLGVCHLEPKGLYTAAELPNAT